MRRPASLALMASLLVNAVGALALVVYIQQAGLHGTIVKLGLATEVPPNFAELARERFGELPGAPVVFFGDSQIQDGPFSEYAPGSARRGIGAQTIADVTTWVDQVLYPQTTRLVILVGTNDALQHRTAEQERPDYRKLFERVTQARPDVTIVMLTVPGRRGFGAESDQVNDALRATAAEVGVQVLEVAKVVSRGHEIAPEFTTDGTHLNGAGYRAAGAILKQAATG